jgi:hypothetical protein
VNLNKKTRFKLRDLISFTQTFIEISKTRVKIPTWLQNYNHIWPTHMLCHSGIEASTIRPIYGRYALTGGGGGHFVTLASIGGK